MAATTPRRNGRPDFRFSRANRRFYGTQRASMDGASMGV
jgi:hypothetical protein